LRLHADAFLNLKIPGSEMDSAQQFLPLLYGKREAAHVIGISLRTLHSLIAKSQLCTVRIGRRVLVPHAELLRFCNENLTLQK
jgi:excisionase family DNA binding protein